MEMMDYIKEQPAVLQHILDDRKNVSERFSDIFISEKPDRIYLIASGTSRNATKAAAAFMEKFLRVDTIPVSSTGAVSFNGKKPLLIYISQGGNSTNTIEAIERNKGLLSIAMTGNPKGVVNTLCSNYIEIPCGEETAGPKTKGYTSTILQLYIFAIETSLKCNYIDSVSYSNIIKDIECSIANINKNIELSMNWMKTNEEMLKSMKAVYIAGKGISYPIADESALKIMETLLIPAFGFEFEEYLHGPSCSIDSNVAGFYFLPDDEKDKERVEKLAAYHREQNKAAFTIGGDQAKDSRDLALQLSRNIFMRPFEYIIPIQIISASIPALIDVEGVGMKRFKALDDILKTKAKRD